MITGLHHVSLGVAELDAAVATYQALLGRDAAWHSADRAWSPLANMGFEICAQQDANDGLRSLGFTVADAAKAYRLLGQRALPVSEPARDDVLDAKGGILQRRIAMQAPVEKTHGVAISLIEQQAAATPAASDRAAVNALDHVVIRTPHPERCIALYAGRFGLDLRLDLARPDWGVRLLFFRCGDLIVEVAHDLKAGLGDGPDQLWGLSWRVADIAAAQARLRSAGFDVSDIRTGRRPKTRVCTVRNRTFGVPTLLIGPDAA